ncbi:MAG TPA: PQQ-binding-like beta-propeller repeat protein [Gemmatimonadaceae bacterium]|jgi:outer membrane protein assembly factor BamB|nr:PQQ-binding-like beta-propeller repeat protein [Gemmatimonadaceae bacterium]
MPRDPRVLVFIGIKDSVVALDEKTGYEVWRTQVRSAGFVYVVWDGASLYAASGGEVWRLNPETGDFIWHNELKGLGRGLLSIASTRAPGPQSNLAAVAAIQAAEAAAAASAAT